MVSNTKNAYRPRDLQGVLLAYFVKNIIFLENTDILEI